VDTLGLGDLEGLRLILEVSLFCQAVTGRYILTRELYLFMVTLLIFDVVTGKKITQYWEKDYSKYSGDGNKKRK
jgi:hypothetical protein